MKGAIMAIFRPLDNELLQNCPTVQFCKDCKYRIGCPIRRSFYSIEDELQLEIFLQTAELKFQKAFGEDEAFGAVDHLRQKIYLEKRNNPIFSYI